MWSKIIAALPSWPIWIQALLVGLVPIVLMELTSRLRSAMNNKGSSRMPSSSAGVSRGAPREPDSGHDDISLTGNFDQDMEQITQSFARNADVHIRTFTIKGASRSAALIYIDGLLHQQMMDESLLRPLMSEGFEELSEGDSADSMEERMRTFLVQRVLHLSNIQELRSISTLAEEVLAGSHALLVEGMPGALLVGCAKDKSRDLQEPLSEGLLRGPRVGFVERLEDNTALLRMYGRNESMFIEKFQVGSRVKKDLALVYMKDIAAPGLVSEVRKRTRSMDMDALLDSGYVEQLIEDNKLSPFQQVHNTERPDRVMGALLEGRVGILLDGSPFALIAPATFGMLLQSPEDYYDRWLPGTFLRLLRFLAATLALLAPAMYISFISYHPGLIPTKLVVTIIETRQGVPFPSIIEALIMEISIEILREAGIRLPKPIGPAMGIVGGLIIGDAAVQAGIISPFLVIVVAVTAISSFAIPTYSAGITLRILRFAAMFSAAMLGLYGVVMFFLFLCIHICRLSSFGVPYSSPAVPYHLADWKDFLIRAPLPMMKRRPVMMNPTDEDRT